MQAVAEEVYLDGRVRRQIQDNVMDHMKALLAEYRAEVADFLNCKPNEVAVCESTTGGLNIVLWGYDFKPGDEIISSNLENSAMYAALNTVIHRCGVVVRYADLGQYGEKDSVQAVKELITDRTKMVMMSHTLYFTGAATDVKGISALCAERGIISAFDGVQTVATSRIDLQDLGCDCYSGASHKFLCGPDGAGFTYISERVQHLIEPTVSGAFTDAGHSVRGYCPKDTAEKYDVSTRPYYVQAGSLSAIRYFRTQVGEDFAYARIHALRERLRCGLSEIEGVKVLSIRENSENAALVLFRIENCDPRKLGLWLISKKINCRPAEHFYPPEYMRSEIGVRLAVNYWNTEEDIDKVIQIIRSAAAQGIPS